MLALTVMLNFNIFELIIQFSSISKQVKLSTLTCDVYILYYVTFLMGRNMFVLPSFAGWG